MSNPNDILYTEILQVVIYSDQVVNNTIDPIAPYLLVAADNSQLSTPNFNSFIDHCSTIWQKLYFIIRNDQSLDGTSEVQPITYNIDNIINYVKENNLIITSDIDLLLFNIIDSVNNESYMFSSNTPAKTWTPPGSNNQELRNIIPLYMNSPLI